MKWSVQRPGELEFHWDGVFASPTGYSLAYNLNVGNGRGSANYVMNFETFATYGIFSIPLLTQGKTVHFHIIGITPAGQFKLYYGSAEVPVKPY